MGYGDPLPPVYDVIFIVEGTAYVGGYYDSLKPSYIIPIVE